MTQVTRTELMPGVYLTAVHTMKFKSSYMGIQLLTPLSEEHAAANAQDVRLEDVHHVHDAHAEILDVLIHDLLKHYAAGIIGGIGVQEDGEGHVDAALGMLRHRSLGRAAFG